MVCQVDMRIIYQVYTDYSKYEATNTLASQLYTWASVLLESYSLLATSQLQLQTSCSVMTSFVFILPQASEAHRQKVRIPCMKTMIDLVILIGLDRNYFQTFLFRDFILKSITYVIILMPLVFQFQKKTSKQCAPSLLSRLSCLSCLLP